MEVTKEGEKRMRQNEARPKLVGRCPKCRKVTPLTRHHIVPRSEGGPDEETNIELVCRPCHNALHRMQPRQRSVSKAVRQSRKTKIKALKAQVRFECVPRIEKCRDCDSVCMNFVLELLAIFFRWLDEVTTLAFKGATA
jgi:hypothetical protein